MQTVQQRWAPVQGWPKQAVVKIHSINSEMRGEKDKLKSEGLVNVEAELRTIWLQENPLLHTASQSNWMAMQSCRKVYCIYLNSDKATRGKCSADHQARGNGCSQHPFHFLAPIYVHFLQNKCILKKILKKTLNCDQTGDFQSSCKEQWF